MKYVDPKVYILASTDAIGSIIPFLEEIGAPGWTTDAAFGEELIEIAGRLCYKSFAPGLNANVSKVREGNKEYIENILKQHHGSVLEHSSVTFALLNVSRILTHEIVRHRAGTAFSQESGRYVRLDEFQMYRPDAIGEIFEQLGDSTGEEGSDFYDQLQEMVERYEREFNSHMNSLPWDRMDFHQKKLMTSAMRRFAPAGTTNNIIVTANHRAWRHMIEMRTSDGAEEEIRKIFYIIATQLAETFPNIYQDIEYYGDGGYCVKFQHSKV